MGPTGKERWNQLVALEALSIKIRRIVLIWTTSAKATLPDHYHWAKDLRRARTNVYGGLFRLFDVMAQRSVDNDERMDLARADALTILEMCREYVDIRLPAPKSVIAMHYGTREQERSADEKRA